MSVSGDLGISPVLLQAISSLTSRDSRHQQQQQQQERVKQEQLPAMEKHPTSTSTSKVISHLLQGMNEPVSALLQSSSSPGDSSQESEKGMVVGGAMGMVVGGTHNSNNPSLKQEEVILNAAIQERLASHLVMNQRGGVAGGLMGHRGGPAPGSMGGSPSAADVSMVNVLTALASQHMKANIKQEESSSSAPHPPPPPPPPTFMTSPHTHTAGAAATATTAAEVVVQRSGGGGVGGDLQDDRPQPQIVIYFNNEHGSVPSPGNDVIVGELEGDGGQGSVQNYRVVMHHGDGSGGVGRVTAMSEPTAAAVQVVTEAAAVVGGSSPGGTFVVAGSNNNAGVMPEAGMTGVCPICGDKLSGYHYGVFTCESCKGFFKRTVQNKKSFMCHKQGECEINVFNRKKCPACRFSKCLDVGMRLEAIRQDRTRGGRSSYEGCSPHGKPRASPVQRKMKRPSAGSAEEDAAKGGPMASLAGMDLLGPDGEGKSHRQLVAILNHSNRHGEQVPDGEGQRVPELLTDIMNLEALLADDDIPQEGPPEDAASEAALYNYLMQLTELRLYKLVRWARNLPQFGAISTDDQIILLQNCWSDLLALGVCWRSIATPTQLSISTTRSISQGQADALGFGDVVGRLMSIAHSLRGLHVDQYEYVALKVLLLITPDVKGLKEPSKIREYQEKLAEALLDYTSSHYAHIPAKFGEMLLRLPELARISFLAKEILLTALPPASTSCGLLVELLKGENAVKD